ncbi:aminotransferase class I/II-fold pyridoxal phosphate-dependent enzyme [Nonomuraea sp. MG754425]|nr:aminotransferase class I/II-fold pyridoxal phosphate-dependent enzyme [Nonomuraea sp. MG754425]
MQKWEPVNEDLPVIQFQGRTGVLDLGWGHPHPDALPVEAWQEANRAAADAFGWHCLTYGHATGPGPLVDWLTAHLRTLEDGGADPAGLFVTAGASHGLSLVATVLAEPGDVVLVDAPTYHYGLRILRDRAVELVQAPTDDDGIDPAALESLLTSLRRAGRRVPLLYLVPTFGNPTGRSLPGDRRLELVRVARRTGLVIIEDDTYREIHYDGPPPASLWRLAEGRSVVRIGSFSKTVAPGLRLGWINAEPSLVRTLSELGYVDSGGGVNHSVAMAMARFGDSGAYDRHVERVRHFYRRRRDILVGELRTAAPTLPVEPPAGGWFLWLKLPDGLLARDLLPVAERHGVSFVEGQRFYPNGSGGLDHLRLSFSLLSPDELAEAGRRLGRALSAATRSNGD